jgi:hypothetical protein
MDTALFVGPKACEGAKESAFAAAGRAGYEHGVAWREMEVDRVEQGGAVGPEERQTLGFETVAGKAHVVELELGGPEFLRMLDAAHEARRKMWNTNRVARQAEYAALTKELSTDKFDPREVIALRKKTRAKIDAGFDDVQATWLAFWDVLNPAQRKILIGYMRDQHAVQGKASAAASAERSAARAKQQAAIDRAEARAAAQGGSTSSATTAPAGAVTSPK